MALQFCGIAILLAFYGCYFTKMFNQRKKGIQTDQLGKGKTGSTRIIELSTKLATYLAAFAEIVCILLNTSSLPSAARAVGACLGIGGAAVFILSVVTMRDNWRAGVSKADRTELVTGGIYRISRNPAFLGFDLVYAGILLLFFHWALLLASALAAIALHLQIVQVEEPYLRSVFGTEYQEYSAHVCRYIGRKF